MSAVLAHEVHIHNANSYFIGARTGKRGAYTGLKAAYGSGGAAGIKIEYFVTGELEYCRKMFHQRQPELFEALSSKERHKLTCS